MHQYIQNKSCYFLSSKYSDVWHKLIPAQNIILCWIDICGNSQSQYLFLLPFWLKSPILWDTSLCHEIFWEEMKMHTGVAAQRNDCSLWSLWYNAFCIIGHFFIMFSYFFLFITLKEFKMPYSTYLSPFYSEWNNSVWKGID